jgi:xanthine dehydrogenase iron-sulfur cluster and FAD-binding subunit A
MVSSWQGEKVQHRAVNACLCPMYAVEGCHVVTVEGEQARCDALLATASSGGGGQPTTKL